MEDRNYSTGYRMDNALGKQLSPKIKFQLWVYLVFYVCVGISLITGLGLMIELGPKNLKKTIEEIHVLSIYYLLTSIVLYISGVLLAEFTNQREIISKL